MSSQSSCQSEHVKDHEDQEEVKKDEHFSSLNYSSKATQYENHVKMSHFDCEDTSTKAIMLLQVSRWKLLELPVIKEDRF